MMLKQITKRDLAIKLNMAYPEVSISKGEKIIDHLVSNILVAVKENQPVKIPRLGTFVLKKIKGRKVMNPATKEIINTKPYLAIKFRASGIAKSFIRSPRQ